jgi:4-hydroxyacetophenone monooxygenase
MSSRTELLTASDDDIDDAVGHGDPMVLRGLAYQLTGDESIAATAVGRQVRGFLEVDVMLDPADVELVRSRTAEFLKRYRDQGAGELAIGPADRLPVSMGLTTGMEIPAQDVELWREQLALDPWSRGLVWPDHPAPARLGDFSVAVIGAGMGGLNAAIQLKHAGIEYVVIEKNSEVGGTWHENRYPGARVDTPSRGYTHVYGVDFPYPNPFCPQSENEKYFNWMADHFEIRDDIEFDTEVKACIWDSSVQRWEVQAVGPDGPRTWRVNAIISAVGFLSRPNIPELPGLTEFAGDVFHTARWPGELDVDGKRVAVIGSGCTSYQLIPELAKSAGGIALFQRTPSWCFEIAGYLEPYPKQINWLDRNLPFHTNFMRLRAGWLSGPEVLGRAFDTDEVERRDVRAQRLEFLRRKFADRPDLLEKMTPEAPPMSSRPVLVDEDYSIYDVLARGDVTLVTDAISRVGRDGILSEDGVEHPVDVIVLATGFKANDFLWPMDVRGVEGTGIEQLWSRDGARAYLGSMLPGFPNFFTVYGPNTNPAGGLGVAAFEEMETRFALECLAHLITRGKSSVQVSAEAYWRYNDELDRAEQRKIYSDPRVTNYYRNEFGRSAANCPFDGRKMWAWLRDPTGEHPAAGHPINHDSSVRPFFGQDLIVE